MSRRSGRSGDLRRGCNGALSPKNRRRATTENPRIRRRESEKSSYHLGGRCEGGALRPKL
jgi:hypothetical protein